MYICYACEYNVAFIYIMYVLTREDVYVYDGRNNEKKKKVMMIAKAERKKESCCKFFITTDVISYRLQE